MNTKRDEWEGRANQKSTSLESVLFKGLPARLNRHIHEQHQRIICDQIISTLPPSAMVLDLGCGWGRISEIIANRRPDVHCLGLDFSSKFCGLYMKQIHAPAVCADITAIPFASNSFDCVIAITVLMYVQQNYRIECMDSILNLLKPGGRIISIEPGAEYMTAAGLFSERATANGLGLSRREFNALGATPASIVRNRGGFPGTSLAIALKGAIGNNITISNTILSCAAFLDKKFSWASRFSAHRWSLIERVKA